MATEPKSLVIPAIVSSDLEKVHPVRGVIVGVAPYVAPNAEAAAEIVELIEGLRYDPSGKKIAPNLRSMLEDDEVVYLVVGKWPSQTSGVPPIFAAADPELSEGARRLSRLLSEGAQVNLVVGPRPTSSDSSGGKTCSECGQLLP